MNLDVINKKGEKIDKIKLNAELFEVSTSIELIKQYIRVFLHNQRQGTSSTKTRSEISRSGKKIWRQKGTGRARMGDLSSPIFKGGAIAHGPKPRSWNLDMPKRMKINALLASLSTKIKNNHVMILDELSMTTPKTTEITALIENLKLNGKTLLITKNPNANVVKSASNIKKVIVSNSTNLNAFEVITADNIIFEKDSIIAIQEKYENK